MSYTAAAGLGVAGAVLLDLAVLRTRLVAGVAFWLTYPIVLVFQLLSNGVLTGREIVRYDPEAIIGWRLAHAPVEDLAFGFALVLATLSLWARLGRPRRATGTARPTPPAPPPGERDHGGHVQ